MATLTEVHQRELDDLLALRASNEAKLLPSADERHYCGPVNTCVCQAPPSGAMVQCELCRELFHCDCVVADEDELQSGRAWLCPYCRRSKKPPLDKVLPLLAALQRIRVRLPEGDALRFLIERTVQWQHRVQQACTDGVLQKVAKMVSEFIFIFFNDLTDCFFFFVFLTKKMLYNNFTVAMLIYCYRGGLHILTTK